MSFIPAPNCVRVDIGFQMAGQQVHNIIWCKRDSPWTSDQRDDLNDAIANWWNTNKSYFSTSIGLVQVTTVNQDTDNAPSSVKVVSPVNYGTTSGGSMPANVATCVTLRTDLRGRSYRGRFYATGMPKSTQYDEVLFQTSWITNLLIVLNALNTAIEALGAIWVVVSKWHNSLARSTAVATEITALAADQYVDSQRRRLGLRGV